MIVVKGAGDIATGIALRLYAAGIPFMMTDLARPTAIRRTVCFSEAIRNGDTKVENVKAKAVYGLNEVSSLIKRGIVPVIADESAECVKRLRPYAVVDAILAKVNMGTKKSDARVVVAIGPGFTAGVDCHAVIETMRGHTLGRMILDGSALPNTGTPGNVGGATSERIIRATRSGTFEGIRAIGDIVKKGEAVAKVNGECIYSQIDGVLRGLLPDGTSVYKGMKSGDVDPRCEVANCYSASDKALAVGGGTLCALLHLANKNDERDRLWDLI